MSKPGKVLKGLCKKLGVRLTVKRGKKRVYKSIKVLKRQCDNKKKVKKKVKRRRKLRMGGVVGAFHQQNALREKERVDKALNIPGIRRNMTGYMGAMNMNKAIRKFNRSRDFLQEKMAIPGGIKKNLQRADLRGAFLPEANLEEARLRGADLIGANLREANLENANLEEALLIGANLTEANLENANLENANLSNVTLDRANLQRAKLGAILINADLRGADLRGADLRGAFLPEAYLRGARYNDNTEFPEGVNPQERGMVRLNRFGKIKRKRKK